MWIKLRQAHMLAEVSPELRWGCKFDTKLMRRTRLSFSAIVRVSGGTVSGYLEMRLSFLKASCSGLMQELVTSKVCSLQPMSYTALQFSSCSSMNCW